MSLHLIAPRRLLADELGRSLVVRPVEIELRAAVQQQSIACDLGVDGEEQHARKAIRPRAYDVERASREEATERIERRRDQPDVQMTVDDRLDLLARHIRILTYAKRWQ